MATENINIVGQAVSLCEGMLEKTGIDRYLCYVGLSVSKLARGLVFFGGAFVIGFCFKRYFKILFGCIFFTTMLYLVLHYNNLISIDWSSIKELLGMSMEQEGLRNIFGVVWGWMKSNLFLSIATGLGFFLGYTIG